MPAWGIRSSRRCMRLLKKRGVAFRFFHRLEAVRLADPEDLAQGERAYVKALEFDVQAKIKDGKEYAPLMDVAGLPCWPSKPDYSQLIDGSKFEREKRDFESHWDRRKTATKTLRVIDDFDFVVLGVGLGSSSIRVPGLYSTRSALARYGDPSEDGKYPGFSDLASRRYGTIRMARSSAGVVGVRASLRNLGGHEPLDSRRELEGQSESYSLLLQRAKGSGVAARYRC